MEFFTLTLILYAIFAGISYLCIVYTSEIVKKRVPTYFTFNKKNKYKSIRFLREIQLKNNKTLIIDFSKNKEYSIHLLYLLNIVIDNIKKTKKQNIQLNFSKNKELENTYNEISSTTNSSRFLSHNDDKISLKTGKDSVDFLNRVGFTESSKALYIWLVEIMDNSTFHFIQNKKYSNYPNKKWWYIMEYNQKNKSTTYSFFDFGPGITDTYSTTITNTYNFIYLILLFILKLEEMIRYSKSGIKSNLHPLYPIIFLTNNIYHLFFEIHTIIIYINFKKQRSKLIPIFLDQHGSSTGKTNRGKGFPKLYELINEKAINSFLLYTNNISLSIKGYELDECLKSEKYTFNGTFLYWEINQTNLHHG